MDELAMTLSALRKRAGISMDRMSRELGLPPAEISGVEHGTRVFTHPKYISDWASIAGADDQEQRLLTMWQERAGAAGSLMTARRHRSSRPRRRRPPPATNGLNVPDACGYGDHPAAKCASTDRSQSCCMQWSRVPPVMILPPKESPTGQAGCEMRKTPGGEPGANR